MTRRSDLESLLFSLLTTLEVQLPWDDLEDKVGDERKQMGRAVFENTEEFWSAMKLQRDSLPDPLKLLLEAIAELGPYDVPKYDDLADLLTASDEMPPTFVPLLGACNATVN